MKGGSKQLKTIAGSLRDTISTNGKRYFPTSQKPVFNSLCNTIKKAGALLYLQNPFCTINYRFDKTATVNAFC
jgi:hypothetical protein